MTVRVPVQPGVVRWALERAGMREDNKAFQELGVPGWLSQEKEPTLKQLERFAQKTHVPFGMLFLPEPPKYKPVIPDFRVRGGAEPRVFSGDLTDMIHIVQGRQEWFRDYAVDYGLEPNRYVDIARLQDSPSDVAQQMRDEFEYNPTRYSSTDEARRDLFEIFEEHGFLVFISGKVGSGTHRALDPQEFSGFSLFNEYAPAIFVNGRDTKNAQVFTLLHELGHLLLGQSGVSDSQGEQVFVGSAKNRERSSTNSERWCDSFAAHFLVPADQLREQCKKHKHPAGEEQIHKLSRVFSASTLTVLNRMYSEKLLSFEPYRELYNLMQEEAIRAAHESRAKNSGGDYYRTQHYALGKRFTQALVQDARRGRTSYVQAQRLLDVKKAETYRKLAQKSQQEW